jgi:hypothetical protein
MGDVEEGRINSLILVCQNLLKNLRPDQHTLPYSAREREVLQSFYKNSTMANVVEGCALR